MILPCCYAIKKKKTPCARDTQQIKNIRALLSEISTRHYPVDLVLWGLHHGVTNPLPAWLCRIVLDLVITRTVKAASLEALYSNILYAFPSISAGGLQKQKLPPSRRASCRCGTGDEPGCRPQRIQLEPILPQAQLEALLKAFAAMMGHI